MNLHLKSIAFIILFTLLQFSLLAQLNVSADRPNAKYDKGEFMSFVVNSGQSGTATYVIQYDKDTPELASGTIEVTAGTPAQIFYQHDEPGSVICEVQMDGELALGGAVFSPYQIKPFEEEPADFDAFWNNEKAKLAQVPMDPVLTFEAENEFSTTFRINLANIENRRVYGYISIPKGEGPFPAFLTLPSFGNNPGLVQPEIILPAWTNAISMYISVLNVEPDELDPDGYQPNDITDKDKVFYRYGLMGAVRAIDYIFSRDDFDGVNLGVNGVSQGGGLATIVAGLDQRVKVLAASNPSHGQQTAIKYGKASAFPYSLNLSILQIMEEAHIAATTKAVKYYDGMYFARRFKGAVLYMTGYIDEVNPPATVFAIFNQFPGPKIMLNAPLLTHLQNPDAYWLGRFAFYRRHFENSRTAPFPFAGTTTGFYAYAGEDQTVDVEESINVSGFVEVDGEKNNNLPVEWQLICGPGEVTFGQPNQRETSVSFSQPGNYTLAFTAYDHDTLANIRQFYDIIDQVDINVTGVSSTFDPVLDAQVKVFPNPTVDFLQIDLSSFANESATIRLLNAAGQVVLVQKVNQLPNGNLKLDLPIALSGWHLLDIALEDGRHVQKGVVFE